LAIRVPFPLAEICALRERATKRADALPEGPQGWSISPVDPMKVVEVFESLRVRPGWVLRSYQYRSRGDGNGFVWAMPEGAAFPEPESESCLWGTRTFQTPFARLPFSHPKPHAALEDFREVIEGDGSPLSFLSSSILARELLEFGAMWHGRFWRDVELAIDDPEVAIDGDSITVQLSCSTDLGCSGFFTNVDRYRKGSYVFEPETTDVKVYGGGHIH
jgi:hypothetical protein